MNEKFIHSDTFRYSGRKDDDDYISSKSEINDYD